MNDEFGVLYSATRDIKYLQEARQSAISLKRYSPDLNITLVTDMPGEVNLGAGEPFDQCIPIETSQTFASTFASGLVDRLKALTLTPYQKTLHIDADTKALNPGIERVKDLLESHDLAMTPASPATSRSCAQYGPLYNGGFIGYCLNEKVASFFAAWLDTCCRHFALVGATPFRPPNCLDHVLDRSEMNLQRLVCCDQICMAQHLSPVVNLFNLDVVSLGDEWLFRARGGDTAPPPGALLYHGPETKQPRKLAVADRVVPLFQQPLFQRKFSGVDDLNRQLVQICRQECENALGKGSSNVGGLRSEGNLFRHAATMPALRQLQNMILDAFKQYVNELIQARAAGVVHVINVEIVAWGYILRENDFLGPHTHRAGIVSGTYCLSVPSREASGNGGNIVFLSPVSAASMVRGPLKFITQDSVSAESGMLILFPSYLQHFVHPFRGDGMRVAISFDIVERREQGQQ